MRNLKWISGLAVAVMLAAVNVTAQEKAPAFELTDVHGNTHSLAQYEGKIIVLEWINYDCPFVRKFYRPGYMQKWQEKYTGKGIVWLSICSSAPGTQGHFSIDEWHRRINDQKVKATAVLLDEDGTVGRAYGARTTPHMYVIDKEGNLVYKGGIDDRRSTNSAHVEGARNFVIEALDALLAGNPVAASDAPPYGCSVKYANE